MTCLPDRSMYEEPLLNYYAAKTYGRGDVAALEAEALEANFGIAGAFARRVQGGAPLEDVEAAARVGLLDALRSWTPEGGAGLPSWAKGPMAAEVQKVKCLGQAVRVPTKTLRVAREIEASGEDIDEACARLGKRPHAIKAAIGIRTCELKPDLGTASFEDQVERAEMEGAIARAAACWRADTSTDLLVMAAQSLGQRSANLCSSGSEPKVAMGQILWPEDAEGRLRVLACLDYAMTLAAVERGLDVECWRRHYVNGERWPVIAAELGVARQRTQFRAGRGEAAISRAISDALVIPTEALEIWARRPPEVIALERIGVLSSGSDPLTILYIVEDLEVALTEIDPRHARVWTAVANGCTHLDLAAEFGVGRKTIRSWAARADAALRELLAEVDGNPAQLELSTVDGSMRLTASWWSPIDGESRQGSPRAASVPTVSVQPLVSRSLATNRQAGDIASSDTVGCTGPPSPAWPASIAAQAP